MIASAWWGIDILGQFPLAPGQVKYLIVEVNYFTKRIEAEPFSTISATQCRNFLWQSILNRYGTSESIVTDNGTQFIDRSFHEFVARFKI